MPSQRPVESVIRGARVAVAGASRLGPVAALAAVGGIAALLVVVPGVPSFCPMRVLFHLPCPTCGMTRALRHGLHGDFQSAAALHPLWVPVIATGLALVAAEALGYLRTGRWGVALDRRPVQRVLGALAVALVAVWLARFGGAFGGPAPVGFE